MDTHKPAVGTDQPVARQHVPECAKEKKSLKEKLIAFGIHAKEIQKKKIKILSRMHCQIIKSQVEMDMIVNGISPPIRYDVSISPIVISGMISFKLLRTKIIRVLAKQGLSCRLDDNDSVILFVGANALIRGSE